MKKIIIVRMFRNISFYNMKFLKGKLKFPIKIKANHKIRSTWVSIDSYNSLVKEVNKGYGWERFDVEERIS